MRRTPCSALLETPHHTLLIDAGQMNLAERFPAGSLTGIVLTHFHPDHVQGLFHLRWGTNLQLAVYTPPDAQGCADLYKHPGILDFQPQKKFTPFTLGDLIITPLPLIHSKPTFGYCFEYQCQRIAYLTDTKGVPEATEAFLAQNPVSHLVIDCTYPPGSTQAGHNGLDDVLEIYQRLKPEKLVLTHIGHGMEHWLSHSSHKLPADIVVGRDGTTLISA